MYKLKLLINKILNKYSKSKRKEKKNDKKLFITKKEDSVFKKRKKQLSLNINKINFFQITHTNKIVLSILL
jgi:hypothetical protein